jgi:hypothetical protein
MKKIVQRLFPESNSFFNKSAQKQLKESVLLGAGSEQIGLRWDRTTD